MLPTEAVENREDVRDEWIAAVEQLVGDAEGWARKQDLAVRREAKIIRQDRLGHVERKQLPVITVSEIK